MRGNLVGGRYRLVRLLGRGGMGEVHEGVDSRNQRAVAVKLLRDLGDGETAERKRFEREIKTSFSLDSPSIVRILDAGSDAEGGPWMVMELLDGEDLSKASKRVGRFAVPLATAIVTQACQGLAIAHKAGIVHRDIKPANLFLANVGDDVVVKIVDFGVARMRPVTAGEDSITDLTQTGALVGSPAYMAPEQIRGTKTVDARADIWSLGVVLYKLLSGVLPHEESRGVVGDMMVQICSTPAPSLKKRAPWVPEPLANAVQAALTIDPEKRLKHVFALRDAIAPYLANGSSEIDRAMMNGEAPPSSRRSTSVGRVSITPSPSTMTPPPSAPSASTSSSKNEPPPRSNRRFIWMGLVGLATTGVGLGALSFAIGGKDAGPAPRLVASSVPKQVAEDRLEPEAESWFVSIAPRCRDTRAAVLTMLKAEPPPKNAAAHGYHAACLTLGNAKDFADEEIAALSPEDRARAQDILLRVLRPPEPVDAGVSPRDRQPKP